MTTLLLALASLSIAADRPSMTWTADSAGRTVEASVGPLGPASLDALRSVRFASEAPRVFDVRVVGADGPAVAGVYRLDGETLRWTPRFPIGRGVKLVGRFRPIGGDEGGFSMGHEVPRVDHPAPRLSRVEPLADALPENLLKFYLYFDRPMSRGEAYRRMSIVDESTGRVVDRPFLELGEELWDPTGTRLTVLLDPGRIKQGLRPHEELGPILRAGRSYSLAIAPGWPDADGKPTEAAFAKRFRAEAGVDRSPDPASWKVEAPDRGTDRAVEARWPRPLDRATVASGLRLVDEAGNEVGGIAEAALDGRSWRFTPAARWAPGRYRLEVSPDVEDLSGNNIRRPFEVDAVSDTPDADAARRAAAPLSLPVVIKQAER